MTFTVAVEKETYTFGTLPEAMTLYRTYQELDIYWVTLRATDTNGNEYVWNDSVGAFFPRNH
jgi:hypothetical protein